MSHAAVMQQGLQIYQRPSYLGEDHIAIPQIQERLDVQPSYTYQSFAPPPTPWWQEWFPFLAVWLPWILYYRDLSVYHVQRALYYGHYLFAYTAWMLGRYKDAAHFYVRRCLFELDDRLRRWADEIEEENEKRGWL